MIATLNESHGAAYGFKVIDHLTAEDVAALVTQLDAVLATHANKPVGVLVDITEMIGATWAARWHEMTFLHRHSDFIARIAIICDNEWQEVAEMAVTTAAGVQAQTRYFHSSELIHAWHWVRMQPHQDGMPVRIIHPGSGLFADYAPEYVGI
jgi:hypothetical protein